MGLRLKPITARNVMSGLWRERGFVAALMFGVGPSFLLLALLGGADMAEVAAALPATLLVSAALIALTCAAAVFTAWTVDEAGQQFLKLRPAWLIRKLPHKAPQHEDCTTRDRKSPAEPRPPRD